MPENIIPEVGYKPDRNGALMKSGCMYPFGWKDDPFDGIEDII